MMSRSSRTRRGGVETETRAGRERGKGIEPKFMHQPHLGGARLWARCWTAVVLWRTYWNPPK
eukprot:495345-Pyramimonas_sp.AAC.1